MSRCCFSVFYWLLLCAAFHSDVFANDVKDLRKAYLSAEKQAWKRDSWQFRRLYKKIQDYPLKPYLDQKVLLSNISLKEEQTIAKFLEKHRGTPLDWPLRKKWLQYLAKRHKTKRFQKYFIANNDTTLNCLYYRYQLADGVSAIKVLPKVTKLWLVGKSQPKVCDPLFKQWQKAGYRTKARVWQRVELAADGGKHTLIPYLTKLLPKKEQYLAKLWHKVRRDPAYVRKLLTYKSDKDTIAKIMTYGLKRLIWRSPKQALKVYDKAVKVALLTENQQQKITAKFALALASKKHKLAKSWLNKVDSEHLNSDLVQWLIADVLRSKDWQGINQQLDKLPKRSRESLQWQYWYGRSLVAIGKVKEGELQLTNLAKKRHYYGFLAASFLGKDKQYNHQPINDNQALRNKVVQYDAAKRAFELFALDRYHQARLEWNYWLSKLSKEEKLIAAKIANEKQWFDRAIFTLAKQKYLNDVELRFPLGFEKQVKKYAKQWKINPAWAFAIIRRESSFMVDANSSVGAKGLMQIMPATAKHLNGKKVSKHDLLKANKSIKLGTKYLQILRKRYNGNQLLATAAYNAGPYRIDAWLKSNDILAADIWIETIPFKETREYVKSVYAYQQIYQSKLGVNQPLFEPLITNVVSRN